MATGKANSFINSFLKLVLNATAIANIADNAASSPLTNLYFSLHTASPGAAGSQVTSEATYPSYARQAVARTTGGFTASTVQTSSPVAAVSFPASTGSPSETETDCGLGTLATTAGVLLWFGAISPTITVNAAGITPQLTTATAISET